VVSGIRRGLAVGELLDGVGAGMGSGAFTFGAQTAAETRTMTAAVPRIAVEIHTVRFSHHGG
jgi:hypothetical protein